MTEVDRARVAPVAAADPDLEVRPGLPPLFHRHFHQYADTLRINRLEGVVLPDPLVEVVIQELASVVARYSVGRLGEVVRAEAEELRLPGPLIRGDGPARNLDHRADEVIHLAAVLLHHFFGDPDDDLSLVGQLGHMADERDHDLGTDLLPPP